MINTVTKLKIEEAIHRDIGNEVLADLMKEASDKIEELEKLVSLARDNYIEDNSDGETDCVTPYDYYT